MNQYLMSTTPESGGPMRRMWVDAASLEHARTLFLSRMRADGLAQLTPAGVVCLEHDDDERESRVRALLGPTSILDDNRLHCSHRDGPSTGRHPPRTNTMSWSPDSELAFLHGSFDASELEAIAWWMRHKKLPH